MCLSTPQCALIGLIKNEKVKAFEIHVKNVVFWFTTLQNEKCFALHPSFSFMVTVRILHQWQNKPAAHIQHFTFISVRLTLDYKSVKM